MNRLLILFNNFILVTSSLYLDYDDETAAGVNSVELDFGSLNVGEEVS